MNEKEMEIGLRIRKVRQSKKITQAQLAAQLGISQTAIALWESGKRSIPFNAIDHIASILDISASYLLFGEADFCDDIPADSQPSLPRSEENDIAKELNSLREKLLSQEGLMFDGEPASPEAIDSILAAMQIGMEMAKKKNKKKYTPKKYSIAQDITEAEAPAAPDQDAAAAANPDQDTKK